MNFSLFISCLTLLVSSHYGVYRGDTKLKSYADLANQPQFDCIGKIYKDTSFIGSCVLVGNKYVLTNTIMIEEFDDHVDSFNSTDGLIVVHSQVNPRIGDSGRFHVEFNKRSYKVSKFLFHPDFKPDDYAFAISMIELTENVDNIQPAKCYGKTDELHQQMVSAGYGESGKADSADHLKKGIKLAGYNTIDSLGGGYFVNKMKSGLYADMDHPTKTICNKMGSSTPLPMEYIPSDDDKGGGLFIKDGDTWYLAGINEYSTRDWDLPPYYGYYGSTAKWTRVSAFKEWIDSVIGGN